MKQKIINVAIVVLASLALTAWGLTTTTGQHIIDSVIDATPIGSTTPSTGTFTTLNASTTKVNSSLPATAPLNSNMIGWNSNLAGDADYLNDSGTGPGGFYWYYTNSARNHSWSASSPLMSLWSNGQLNTTGGFSTASSVSASGGFYGNLSGNATSATSANYASSAGSANVLNSPVNNCAPNVPATGIQTNGNANCGSYPMSLAGNGYTTLPGGVIMQWGRSGTFDTGPVAVNFATVFPHACLQAVVGDASSGSRIESLVSCSQSSITIRNDGSGAATYYAIGY
jgi:hypothetical protein